MYTFIYNFFLSQEGTGRLDYSVEKEAITDRKLERTKEV